MTISSKIFYVAMGVFVLSFLSILAIHTKATPYIESLEALEIIGVHPVDKLNQESSNVVVYSKNGTFSIIENSSLDILMKDFSNEEKLIKNYPEYISLTLYYNIAWFIFFVALLGIVVVLIYQKSQGYF